jgi:ABC-2 type transport system permease protein
MAVKRAFAWIRELFAMYKLYALLDLRWFLHDNITCAVVMVSEFISNIASISGVFLLAVRFDGVGALSADEVLFMLGFFELAGGFLNMMFGNLNVLNISRRVGRGQVDHMLIQPRPLLMQLLAEGFMPVTGCSGFLTGLALTAVSCVRLGIKLDIPWLCAFVIYVLCHSALKIGQSYICGALAFYRPVACEELSSMALDMNGLLGQYPLVGLPGWAMAFLTTVFPVGLMAYVPALILLGKLDKGPVMALPIAVAAAFMTAAVLIFRRGLRHYAQNSCNRYRAMGHRS